MFNWIVVFITSFWKLICMNVLEINLHECTKKATSLINIAWVFSIQLSKWKKIMSKMFEVTFIKSPIMSLRQCLKKFASTLNNTISQMVQIQHLRFEIGIMSMVIFKILRLKVPKIWRKKCLDKVVKNHGFGGTTNGWSF